jgi:hypothetical protein
MAQLIVRVELLGTPDADVYKRLHQHMATLNYLPSIPSTAGSTALPHAMYQGSTTTAAPDVSSIAGALRTGIEAKIWTKAIVLVMVVATWAQSRPPK